MTETLDDNTQASHPGQVRLSSAKLKALQPELYSPLTALIGWDWTNGRLWNRRSWWLTRIKEHLMGGDSRAAVVIDTAPLLVAAYTDELDCVALLRFDKRLVSAYGLQIGSRLITVNLYEYTDGFYETDLLGGDGRRDCDCCFVHGLAYRMITRPLSDRVSLLRFLGARPPAV